MGGVGTEARDPEHPVPLLEVRHILAALEYPAGEFKPGGDGPPHKRFGGLVKAQSNKYIGKVHTGGGDFDQDFIGFRDWIFEFLYLESAVTAGTLDDDFFHDFIPKF